MIVIFYHGNLKDCMMKVLNLLPPSTSDKMLNPSVNYADTKARVEFKEDCLKQEKNYLIMEK